MSQPQCIHCHRILAVVMMRNGDWRWRHTGKAPGNLCATPETTFGDDEWTVGGKLPLRPWQEVK